MGERFIRGGTNATSNEAQWSQIAQRANGNEVTWILKLQILLQTTSFIYKTSFTPQQMLHRLSYFRPLCHCSSVEENESERVSCVDFTQRI